MLNNQPLNIKAVVVKSMKWKHLNLFKKFLWGPLMVWKGMSKMQFEGFLTPDKVSDEQRH